MKFECTLGYSVRYSLFFPKHLSSFHCWGSRVELEFLSFYRIIISPFNFKAFFFFIYSCIANELKLIFVQTNALAHICNDGDSPNKKVTQIEKSDTTDKNGYIPINFTIQTISMDMCVFRNSNRYIKISILMIRLIAHCTFYFDEIYYIIGNSYQLPITRY